MPGFSRGGCIWEADTESFEEMEPVDTMVAVVSAPMAVSGKVEDVVLIVASRLEVFAAMLDALLLNEVPEDTISPSASMNTPSPLLQHSSTSLATAAPVMLLQRQLWSLHCLTLGNTADFLSANKLKVNISKSKRGYVFYRNNINKKIFERLIIRLII
jgi:hypothetical protein